MLHEPGLGEAHHFCTYSVGELSSMPCLVQGKLGNVEEPGSHVPATKKEGKDGDGSGRGDSQRSLCQLERM
jgi:hypothetical protein